MMATEAANKPEEQAATQATSESQAGEAAPPAKNDTPVQKTSPGDDAAAQARQLFEGEGAEDGFGQYCRTTFVSPQAAAIGSSALIDAFKDNVSWLAEMAQPAQLVTELRQSCCQLTSTVIGCWVKHGETHKLARLGDALVDASSVLQNAAAARVMALLASLLSLLRPQRAQRLQEVALPLLDAQQDAQLIEETEMWVCAGRKLQACSASERLFWNQRLRDPDADWEWESEEARQALRQLSKVIQPQDKSRGLFRATVPACWWDLVQDAPAATTVVPAKAEAAPVPRRRGSFTLGLVTGSLLSMALLTGGLFLWQDAASRIFQPQPEQMAAATPEAAPPAPAPSLPDVKAPAVAAQPVPLPRVAATLPLATASKASTSQPAPAPAPAGSELSAERQKQLQALFTQQPGLKKIHSVAKSGKLGDSEGLTEELLYGSSPVFQSAGASYPDLLRALMLDPPDDPGVRQVVAKMLIRSSDPAALIPLLQAVVHPGSPNEMEGRQAAQWLLEFGGAEINDANRKSLGKLLP